MKTNNKKSYIVNAVAILAMFAIIMVGLNTGTIDKYYSGILMVICTNIILAVSLNITTGFLGQIALGHAGFMSIGAYSAAIFVKYMQEVKGIELLQGGQLTTAGYLCFFASLLIAGLMAAIFGFIVGIPALRLKGDYLAIITLGFGEIIRVIAENISITGGAQGLRSIPKLSKVPVVFWVTIITVCILFAFVRSRHGRAIMAIREDDIASEAAGISNTNYKVLAFVIAAIFAGIAGAIYAQQMGVLGAKTFNFNRSIEILIYVVLGGMGSLTGSIVAAIGLSILPEALRSFSDYRMVIYSVILIITMIFKPSGLFGHYEFSLTRALQKITAVFKKPKKGDDK